MVMRMIKKHGSYAAWKEHMRDIASIGGRHGTTGGFFKNRELAREAGRKGGAMGRKGKRSGEA